MNTWKACEATMRQISERFGLSIEEITDIQADQARDFLEMWNYGLPHQIAYSPEDLDLFYNLPEFWVFWRQLWANEDRRLLANTSKLEILEYQKNGGDMKAWYAASHNYKGGQFKPDKNLMDAYETQQIQFNSVLTSFKQFLNN